MLACVFGGKLRLKVRGGSLLQLLNSLDCLLLLLLLSCVGIREWKTKVTSVRHRPVQTLIYYRLDGSWRACNWNVSLLRKIAKNVTCFCLTADHQVTLMSTLPHLKRSTQESGHNCIFFLRRIHACFEIVPKSIFFLNSWLILISN